jgi:Flp pilus assembly protein TadB
VILVLTAIFLATLSVIVGGYVFINRRSLAEADVARDRLRPEDAAERVWTLLKDDRVSEVNFVNRLLTGKDWVGEIGLQLQRAGIEMKPGAFLVLVVASGVLGTLIGAVINGWVLSVALIVIGWAGPFLWLKWKQRRRLRMFETQLPDAIDMLVSAMKAGYSFQAGMQFIGDEMTAPAGPEFARFYDEQRLGIDVRVAMLNMQERMGSLDLKMFVTAVLIQRETGGNLGDVLSNLADLIRERIAMRGRIETLVAEPKMSARFLALMPVVVYFLLSIVSPHFMDPMIHSPGGRIALGLTAVSVVVGYAVLMKIADVDI